VPNIGGIAGSWILDVGYWMLDLGRAHKNFVNSLEINAYG